MKFTQYDALILTASGPIQNEVTLELEGKVEEFLKNINHPDDESFPSPVTVRSIKYNTLFEPVSDIFYYSALIFYEWEEDSDV